MFYPARESPLGGTSRLQNVESPMRISFTHIPDLKLDQDWESASSNLPVNPNHRYNTRPPMQHRLHIQPVWVYTRKPARKRERSRILYALLAIAVIAAGLLWRSGLIPMPPWLSNNGGDALWALMVFVGFGFLLPRASTLVVAVLALAFARGVEFSQLYNAPWIDAIRATIPGKLVLGNTFYWPDLIAYAVGVALGALT
jgi:Protein of unknown function (DUF2809)